jgi:hypothetical protein
MPLNCKKKINILNVCDNFTGEVWLPLKIDSLFTEAKSFTRQDKGDWLNASYF